MNTVAKQPYLKFAFSLALITLLAPTATDMYLVSLPDIARQLNVSYAGVQLTLTVFLMAQGAGQVFFGPLIDRFGRRRPLLAGILVFILCSIWAAGSAGITSLIISRFVQGLAGALLLVVGFSSVRDVADGTRAAQLFAALLTIEGLAPILAPIVGGYVDANFGWRAVLLVSAIMGAMALANSFFALPESLAKDKRLSLRPAFIARTYWCIASDKKFLLPALALSSVFFFLFAFISGGAYLYQEIYGLSADDFGLVLGLSGTAVMLGAIVNGKLVRYWRICSIAVGGALVIIAGTCIAMLSSWSIGLHGIIAGFALALFGLGLCEPALMSLVMGSQKKALGFTAALMGSLHLMLSSLSTPISGYLLPISETYWFVFLLFSGLLSLALIMATHFINKERCAS